MQEGELNVFCLNAFLRPPGIHSGETMLGSGDHKNLRLDCLIQKIRYSDIVLLQETFEIGGRSARIVQEAKQHGLLYHAGSVWPKFRSKHVIDGGLLLLSRYPIVERDRIRFMRCTGADGFCSKGVLYAKIQLSPDARGSVMVFTVHTQAGENAFATRIRLSQVDEMATFIASKIRENPDLPVLIGGDFNIDSLHNYIHKDDTSKPERVECDESEDYLYMERAIEKAVGKHSLKNIMKQYGEGHPITNGTGHGKLSSSLNPEHSDIAKCIDFLFLAVPSGRKHITKLSVVKGSVRMDPCSLFEFQPKNVTFPISNMSDHHGMHTKLKYTIPKMSDWENEHSSYLKFLVQHFPPAKYDQRRPLAWTIKLPITLLGIVITGVSVAAAVIYGSATLLNGK